MIVDAREIAGDSTVDTDVCIVGGGTAGITLAREWIGRNFRVCLLESGGTEPDSQTQELASGDNIGYPYFPLDTARGRLLGGSSHLWHVPIGGERIGARIRPLDPIDFEERDWVPNSGWPFDKAHLDPFYRRAQAICQVEPETFEPEEWEDTGKRPQLALRNGDVHTIIYKFVRRDLFAREYPDEVSRAPNIDVYLHANVLEIDTNDSADRVTNVRVATLRGNEFSVRAKVFILAAGGIEIPRLLLLSKKRQVHGLGNQHDLVGRYFMEHPHFWSGIFLPAQPNLFQTAALYNDVHTVNGVAVIGKLALTEKALRREKLLNQNIQFFWRTVADPNKYPPTSAPGVASLKALAEGLLGGDNAALSRHLGIALKNLDDVVASVGRKIRERTIGLPEVPAITFANMTEQIPNPESRVLLGQERDRFGQNRVQLNWRITKQDVRSAIRTQEIIGGALERAGLGRFFQKLREETPPQNTEGGYHHMGTTRMHADPKRGVVDPDSRVHGLSNLFIAGPSVFPTGGYANPVLTIVALSIRLAEHIHKSLN